MKSTNGKTKDRKGRAGESLAKRLDRPAPTVWLSGQEAAEYVAVCWPTLRQFILEHSIPHVRIGTRWTIELAVLDEHMRRLAELTAVPRTTWESEAMVTVAVTTGDDGDGRGDDGDGAGDGSVTVCRRR